MFRSFLDHHQANIFQQKVQSVRTIRCGIPYSLQGVRNKIITFIFILMGTAVAQWLRCCATNRKFAGSIPDGVIGIFHCHKILPYALWPWGRINL